MYRVMAVGIKPKAMPEACLPREVLFWDVLDIVDESTVRFIQLLQYLGERKAPFLFRHLGIESIDAAVLDVSRWPASCDDERQILQRFLFPRGQVCKDVFHRPITYDVRLHQL